MYGVLLGMCIFLGLSYLSVIFLKERNTKSHIDMDLGHQDWSCELNITAEPDLGAAG
jgi:hypothetical protein